MIEMEKKVHTKLSERVFKQGNFYWNRLTSKVQNLSEDEASQQIIKDVTSYLANHPLIAIFSIAMLIACALPIVMFGVFAVVSILFTFSSFLLIEGTLLLIGLIILSSFIAMVLVIMLTMTASVAVAYYGFTRVFGLGKEYQTKEREQ